MNSFAQKNNLQFYPNLCGPTSRKGITSIILVHSWQKNVLRKITYTMLCLPSWENIAYRSSRPDVFCKKSVLRSFAKFTGKYMCQSLFFNKVTGLRPATLFKKKLWHRCFSVNFLKFLRRHFLQNTFERLILKENNLHNFVLVCLSQDYTKQ